MKFADPQRLLQPVRLAPGRPRRGFTLLECTAAIAILGAALVVTLQLQLAVAAQRRSAEQRQLAGWEVANLMERLSAEPYDRLTSDLTARYTLSPIVAERLRGAQLSIEVTASTPSTETAAASLPAKRVQVALTWHDRQGEPTAPVKLTAWRYPPAEQRRQASAEESP